MSKKEKNCLNCRIHWDRDGGCEVCRWEDEDHPSLFYEITRSPEVLAPHFVYRYQGNYPAVTTIDGREVELWWRSMICKERYYETKTEALAATVAKLKSIAEKGEDDEQSSLP